MGEVCEQVRQVDDILEIARGLGNAHVVATLERAQRTLLRQKAGATQLDTTVLAAARAVRQEQALELQRARALLANGGGGPSQGTARFTTQAACGESACRNQRGRSQGL